jgi:hypothetical protein
MNELTLTKTLKVNKTSAVIPSFKITDTTYDPISSAVGVIVKVFPENVTKEGKVAVIVTGSESMSIVEGSV